MISVENKAMKSWRATCVPSRNNRPLFIYCLLVFSVVLGSVAGVLLLVMIIMAVCVYKPLSRR